MVYGLMYLTVLLALGWRIRLTKHLLKHYMKNNAYYKIIFLLIAQHTDSFNMDPFGLGLIAFHIGLGMRLQLLRLAAVVVFEEVCNCSRVGKKRAG
ncbi:hypothetical protein Leryth_000447 [Lithospermum erythrorhizon]|nr:hypothetical protein Leryth_000447 [Lithospermum erythrorhizon]